MFDVTFEEQPISLNYIAIEYEKKSFVVQNEKALNLTQIMTKF